MAKAANENSRKVHNWKLFMRIPDVEGGGITQNLYFELVFAPTPQKSISYLPQPRKENLLNIHSKKNHFIALT